MTQPQAEPAQASRSRGWIEIAFHGALVAASAFFLWQATQVNEPPTNLVVGPRTFPVAVGGLMLIISAVLLWRLLRTTSLPPEAVAQDDAAVPLEEDETTINDWPAVWAVLSSTLIMFVLLVPLGFVLTISLFLFCLSTFFSPPRWLRNLTVAVIFSVFFYGLFAGVLGIPLPKGVLAPFLTMVVG